jgi:hypothetical protein
MPTVAGILLFSLTLLALDGCVTQPGADGQAELRFDPGYRAKT